MRVRRVRVRHVACENFKGPEAEDRGRSWSGARGVPARRRRDAGGFQRYGFRLGYFEHVFLPLIE
jgi:hypothetical protein